MFGASDVVVNVSVVQGNVVDSGVDDFVVVDFVVVDLGVAVVGESGAQVSGAVVQCCVVDSGVVVESLPESCRLVLSMMLFLLLFHPLPLLSHNNFNHKKQLV